jgi:exopolysaccharide production protein ExoZ
MAFPEQGKPASQKLDSIQLLRAVAAFAVVFFHALEVSRIYSGIEVPFSKIINIIGASGVNLFFLISGFVMIYTTRSLPQAGASVRVFLLRRFTRIVPLYWLVTSLVVAILLIKPGLFNRLEFDAWHVVASYLFIPALNNLGETYPVWGLGWTLNYEMFFYLVMGIMLLFSRRVLWVSLLLGGLVLAGMFIKPTHFLAAFYTSPQLLLFIAGGLVAKWTHHQQVRMPRGFLAAGLLLLSVAYYLQAVSLSQLAVVFQTMGFAGVTLAALSMEASGMLRVARVLVVLGNSSYSLYLTHMLVYVCLAKILTFMGLSAYMLYMVPVLVAGAMLAAHLIYLLLEKPTILALNGALGLRRKPK